MQAGTRLGPYEIVSPLGAGGMGEVYRARDTRLGRLVAVKILPDAVSQDPHRVARFESETRTLATLSHPNVLAIYDVGRWDGRYYAVMELLDGETLRDRMSGERLAWRKAADLAAAIADGLGSRACGRHRPPGPEARERLHHVRWPPEGARFRSCKGRRAGIRERRRPRPRLPRTPFRWMERWSGRLPIWRPSSFAAFGSTAAPTSSRSDCVLYEMLSGKRPFSSGTRADIISAILHSEPATLDADVLGIPPALAGIVFRCLEKRPEDRYDTAHDLALSLRSVTSISAPVSRSVETPRRERGRLLVYLALGASAAIAGLVLITRLPRASPTGTSLAPTWGPPRQITSAPGWEEEPSLSPDGTLIAYSSNQSGKAEVWVVDPEGGESLRLTDSPAENRYPVWFPDGRSIAFVSTQNGSSSIRKVSRLGGSAGILLEHGEMPAISPDGSRIAFTRVGASALHRIWVAPLDDPSRARRLTGEGDGAWEHMDPAWSPDGTLLCYSAFHDLWIVPAAGGKPRQLTSGGKLDQQPEYSPDGLFLYFSSLRSGTRSLWRVPAGGGEPERILAGTGVANHPSLSHDGRRIVFSTLSKDGDVVVLDRKTGGVSRIASSKDDEQPTLAPDGSAVAYVSNRLGTYDLWIEALETGQAGKMPARRLTTLNPGPATPVYSPDGRWIAFFRPLKQREIWAVPMNGGAPIPIVQGLGNNIHPTYASDSTRLAFVSDRAGGSHVWVLPLRDGRPDGAAWPLTKGEVTDVLPAWSPDGGRIAFLRGEDLCVIEARPDATPHPVLTGAGVHHLAWEPDGAAVVASGLFGAASLRLRRVVIATGATEPLKTNLVLGDRDTFGYVSLSRDGRYLATEITDMKGNVWITTALRDGR